ncbi:MAG TPA: carboxypeptidase regulatory-like domain-containing protein, partial [Terriglobales bacterium]|nr:carboxypeptidase regulatory-like domain-containing protein [Terriglobales bacterium]
MRIANKLLVVSFLLCLSSAAFGQATGLITGTVRDTTGAVIQGADMVLTDVAKVTQLSTITNAEGNYLFAGLGSGAYDLTVTAAGFKKFQARGVRLQVAEKARLDVTLQVGAVTSEVTVEGPTVAQVETQSSELAGVVGGKEITQLQLNGRNFVQLATLVPGVSNQSGQDEGTVGVYGNATFSINGGRTEYNNWELDGGDNMDNGSNYTLNVYPSIDAIAEFRVLTSNYSAQYGRNGSGTVQVETKSGTNAFHGNLYEFVRNDAFNARNYFEQTVPSYKKNDFGYTVGGPIYIPGHYNTSKDKTFFFWSQEWRRDRIPSLPFNQLVPSSAQRAGNFSELCPSSNAPFAREQFPDCPGTANPDDTYSPYMTSGILNQVPVDPVGRALLPLIPLPNTVDNYFTGSVTLPTNWREELIRVDHNFSSKLRGMFRYIHDSWNTVTEVPVWTGSAFPTVQTNFKGPGVSLVARLTANPTTTLVNEFTFSYTTDHIFFGSTGTPNPNAWRRPANLPMGYLFNNGFGGKLPEIILSGGKAYGGGFDQEPNGEWPEGIYNSNPTYTFRDNVSRMIGRHNLQFGAYFAAAQKNELSSALVNGSLGFDNSSPVSTGNAFADLLMGQVSSYSQGSNQLKYYYRYKIVEPYLQDDWRITDRL